MKHDWRMNVLFPYDGKDAKDRQMTEKVLQSGKVSTFWLVDVPYCTTKLKLSAQKTIRLVEVFIKRQKRGEPQACENQCPYHYSNVLAVG